MPEDSIEIKKVDEVKKVKISYTNEQIELVKSMYARNATNDELKLLLYMSKKYNLDILTREIWLVKFGDQPAQIYAGRDGFLKIAHGDKSDAFNGFNSDLLPKNLIDFITRDRRAYCEVFRKDMSYPIRVVVNMKEYNTGKSTWKKMPITMIKKVAESQALRKAFTISGVYSPEEMGQWEVEQEKNYKYIDKTTPKTKYKSKFPTNREYWDKYDWSKVDLKAIPPSRGFDKEKKKPQSSMESLKLYFYSCDLMPKEAVTGYLKKIVDKKTYQYTYGDIKTIVGALKELEDEDKETEELVNEEFPIESE